MKWACTFLKVTGTFALCVLLGSKSFTFLKHKGPKIKANKDKAKMWTEVHKEILVLDISYSPSEKTLTQQQDYSCSIT